MAGTRIVMVGGGSYQWGPGFLRDLLVAPELEGSTLVLHDIDPAPLELVHRLGTKLMERHQRPFILEQTTDLAEALRGAEIVILTITTGGLETMRHDLEIPAKYGIHQSVGDTVGPGGLSRALRTIPVIVDLARRMEALCPDAWLLNYTNPMTTLCRAATRESSVRTVGLCHELIGILRWLEKLLPAELSDMQVRAGGINHLLWIAGLSVDGRDAFPDLARLAEGFLAKRGDVTGAAGSGRHGLSDRWLIKSRLFQIFGALPAAGDRHLAEFFPYFLGEDAERGRRWGVELTHVEERHRWREAFLGHIQQLLAEDADTASFMARPSDEAAGRIAAALASGRPYSGIVNLPNQGQIPELPLGAVVETFGQLDATGAHGLAVGALPRGALAVLRTHVENQERIVEAALAGDRALALEALISDPLVRDLDAAPRMLDELIDANRAHLPQFS